MAVLYGKLLVALLVGKVIRHTLTISTGAYDVAAAAAPQSMA
ncbi:MAG: hypothetical protein OXH92_12930 [Bryobacterales bacterium]|nr:hypothetical protein [Bryobacterales bacterium]